MAKRVDVGWIALLRLAASEDGVEFVEFICPGCNERHESPRLG
jgi:hypothetical protein